MAELSELVKILDRQAELIDELGAMARAYEYCYKSFCDKWAELVKEGHQMIADFESGEADYMSGKADTSDIKEKMSENLIKTKLMREVVCLMGEVLREFREGGDECSE